MQLFLSGMLFAVITMGVSCLNTIAPMGVYVVCLDSLKTTRFDSLKFYSFWYRGLILLFVECYKTVKR